MTIGYPLNKASLDAKIGHIVVGFSQLQDEVERLFELVSRPELSVANLQSEFGYTADEAQTYYDVVFAFHLLNEVAEGRQAVPAASNFLYNAWKVRGVE